MSQQVTVVSETDKDYKLNQISQELKDKMIDDIRNGVDYKHFTVKEFKNGKAQLIRKKTKGIQSPTASLHVQTKDVNESKKNTKQDDDDNDPILDHLAKIHETIGSLKNKNKKRKKQIEEIYSSYGGKINEIYSLFNGNDSENEEEPVKKPAKKEQTIIEEESKPVKEPVKKDLKTNLRSRLKYLS